MGWIGCAILQATPKRLPRLFSYFQYIFFNHLIKNPQTTIDLKFLTHNISDRGGVPHTFIFFLERIKQDWKGFQSHMFRSFHIFVFWFLVFWSLQLRDFLSVFFVLPNLPCKIEIKITWYFHNFVAKKDQKQKMGWTKQKTQLQQILVHKQCFSILDLFYLVATVITLRF